MNPADRLILHPGKLDLLTLREVAAGFMPIELDLECRAGIAASAATVQRIGEGSEPAYGINTGFGKLAKVQIPRDQLALLQANLVRSHAVGVGPLLDDDTVRLIQALMGGPTPSYRHHTLLLDASGRRLAKRDKAETLLWLRERGVDPAQLRAELGVLGQTELHRVGP